MLTTIYPAPGKQVRDKSGVLIPLEGIVVELSDPYYQRRLREGGIVVAPVEAPISEAAMEPAPESPAEPVPAPTSRRAKSVGGTDA